MKPGTRARGGVRRGTAATRQHHQPVNEYQVPTDTQATDRATEAWKAIQPRLKERLYESAFEMWIGPLALEGESQNRLVLAGLHPIVTWIERRYAEVMGEAIREETDFDGAILAVRSPDRSLNKPGWI